ncbi:unnamed protein product [Prunus armeniaca]
MRSVPFKYLWLWTVADLCRRKEVRLHLRSPEIAITDAGVAPLLQTSDAHNVLDEMRKPLGWGAAACWCCTQSAARPGQNDVVLDQTV